MQSPDHTARTMMGNEQNEKARPRSWSVHELSRNYLPHSILTRPHTLCPTEVAGGSHAGLIPCAEPLHPAELVHAYADLRTHCDVGLAGLLTAGLETIRSTVTIRVLVRLP
jgi:hypothetical protein